MREHHAAHAGDTTVLGVDAVDAVAEGEPEATGGGVLAGTALEWRDDAGSGAPGEVEARHGVAVFVSFPSCCTLLGEVPAFSPADDGEPAHAHAVEPLAHRAGRELEVGLGPLPRPEVLRPIEPRGAEPVATGELDAVAHAHAPLLGSVDHEESAQAPERLRANALRPLLLDHDDMGPEIGCLRSGHEAGQTRTHDEHIGSARCAHSSLPSPARR